LGNRRVGEERGFGESLRSVWEGGGGTQNAGRGAAVGWGMDSGHNRKKKLLSVKLMGGGGGEAVRGKGQSQSRKGGIAPGVYEKGGKKSHAVAKEIKNGIVP